jgi:hypothetical protein
MTTVCRKGLLVAILSVSLALPTCITLRDVPMPVAMAARAPNVHTGDVVVLAGLLMYAILNGLDDGD